jgi:hypothetical protein
MFVRRNKSLSLTSPGNHLPGASIVIQQIVLQAGNPLPDTVCEPSEPKAALRGLASINRLKADSRQEVTKGLIKLLVDGKPQAGANPCQFVIPGNDCATISVPLCWIAKINDTRATQYEVELTILDPNPGTQVEVQECILEVTLM